MQQTTIKTILKVLVILFAVVLISVLIIYKEKKKPTDSSLEQKRESLIAYLAIHREGDVFIYKYDLANSKVTAQQKVPQPPEEGQGWWADMAEFQSYPDNIFLVGTVVGSTSTGADFRSYLIIIDRKTLSHKQTIPFDFAIRKMWNIPQYDHIIVDGVKITKERKDFIGGAYTFKDGEIKEDTPPVDVPDNALKYSIYLDKKLIRVVEHYNLDELRTYNLPPEVEKTYDFNKYIQLLMIPDEKKALIAPFRKGEDVRDLLLIDLIENRILNEPIKLYRSKKDDPFTFSDVLLDVSPDGKYLYVFKDYQDKEDHLLIYDINALGLVKEIPAKKNLSGTSPKTIFTDDGKYLIIIFGAPRRGASVPFSYVFLIDREKNDIVSITDLTEGGTSGIILDKQ